MRPDTRAGTITRGWWWGRFIEGGEERGALTGRMTDGYSVTGECGECFPPPFRMVWVCGRGGGDHIHDIHHIHKGHQRGAARRVAAVAVEWQGLLVTRCRTAWTSWASKLDRPPASCRLPRHAVAID